MSAVKKLLILDGRPRGDDSSWPLPPLLDRLERRGFEIRVLCISKGADLTADPRAFELPVLKRRLLRPFAARWFWSEDRLDRPVLIHVLHDKTADVGLALSETGQVPYVQTVAGFATIEHGLRLSRQWCRRLIATSPDLAEELTRALGVPPEAIALIPQGIATQRELFRKPAAWTIPVIGAGGPLEELPGLLIFTEAARLVVHAGYDVEFVIACHANEQIALRHRVKQLGIAERVTVTDYPIAGPDFWSVPDIYCQPAVSASTGRMLMLALARALPCIASHVKGLGCLIDSGRDGILVPPADPVALQNAITALLDDPDLGRRFGQSAWERARDQFDIEVEADRLADLYGQVSSKGEQTWGRRATDGRQPAK
jgi:glycosyltransferase involved in cell wall biosynthesis